MPLLQPIAQTGCVRGGRPLVATSGRRRLDRPFVRCRTQCISVGRSDRRAVRRRRGAPAGRAHESLQGRHEM